LPAKPLMWSHTGARPVLEADAMTRTMYDLYADYCFAVAMLVPRRAAETSAPGNNDMLCMPALRPPYLSGIGFEAESTGREAAATSTSRQVREPGISGSGCSWVFTMALRDRLT